MWISFCCFILLFPALAKAEFDLYEAEKRPFPDNCGLVYASSPITDKLGEILLDDGEGRIRTFYYQRAPENGEKECGDMAGKICFTVLGEMPVSRKLAQKGIKGDKITIIRECMELN